jgi:hypothetical protein
VTVDGISDAAYRPLRTKIAIQVYDELMPKKIEVDPIGRAPPLGQAHLNAVKFARLSDVSHLHCNMKRG